MANEFDVSYNMKLDRDGERIPIKVDIATLSASSEQYIQDIINDAEDYVDKARQWANAPENVEVEPGLYSAFHYKEQAEDLVHGQGIIYLAKDGNDNNSGRTPGTAFRTFPAALDRLWEMSDDGNNLVLLKVYPGSYTEMGNLRVPPNGAVVSEGGQFVTELIAAPGYEETNMFLLNSGSYMKGFAFRNQRVDDFDNPTVGFAYAFDNGAKIFRSPYVRDSSQLSNYNREKISAPLDPEFGNPEVGRGGGMILADRSVIDPNSIFPYMLAFGATPRTPNGLGYVAKNGAGINGISSLTIFSRNSFYALNGGQITLNNSGTQFGDISMRARGSMQVITPELPNETVLVESPETADLLRSNRLSIINNTWDWMQANGYGTTWQSNGSLKKVAQKNTAENAVFTNGASIIENNVQIMVDDLYLYLQNNYNAENPTNVIDWSAPRTEELTRRDATWLLTALIRDLALGIDNTSRGFVEGMYNYDGTPVFEEKFRGPFLYAWDFLQAEIKRLTPANQTSFFPMMDGLFDLIRDVVNNEADREDTKVVIPDDLETYHAPSMDGYDVLWANAEIDSWPSYRDNSLINDMWTFMLNNEPQMCFSGVDWTAGDLETLTKRDAQWLLSAAARDIRHGNTQSTRRFVEGLFNRNGDFVFAPEMKCSFKLAFDFLAGELRVPMQEADHQALLALVDLVKSTLDNPTYGFSDNEYFTRRDTDDLIKAIAFDITGGKTDSTVGLSLGFFDYTGNLVFDPSLVDTFVATWDYILSEFKALLPTNNSLYDGVSEALDAYFLAIKDTVTTPDRLTFNSLIESLGHQFNNAGAGVNKNALPLNFRRGGSNRTVPFTIQEQEGGRVRWSGSDELNNQYLAGGTRINGLTGRIEGRPFDAAVRQIARRIANTRGSF